MFVVEDTSLSARPMIRVVEKLIAERGNQLKSVATMALSLSVVVGSMAKRQGDQLQFIRQHA